MAELNMTGDAFCGRLGCARRTLDKWLLPAASEDFRTWMKRSGIWCVENLKKKFIKTLALSPLGRYNKTMNRTPKMNFHWPLSWCPLPQAESVLRQFSANGQRKSRLKLKPAEILKHLGFDIPDDGIEINGDDAYLFTSALQLAGQSIDFDRIEDAKLAELHRGLAGIVTAWSEGGLIAPIAVDHSASSESLLALRATLNAVLQVNFRRQAAHGPQVFLN